MTWLGKEGVPQLGDCRAYFGCAGQVWPFPATDDCSPLSQTPHMGCASARASVCTRSCLLSLPFLLLCLKAEKHHFSCCLLLGFRQVWNNEGFAGFTCGQLYLMKISWGFLNNTVFKITKIQSLQILLWTFHSHAQTVLHVLCRQGEIISSETLYAFLDDILLFPYRFFFCLFFLPAPSYINSVSSSFRDRWWAGGTNELPAAQGRRIEMLCALRTNRLSTLTEDVTHVMKGLMHKYCCRLFFTDTYEPCFPKRTTSQNSLPNSPILTVFIGLLLWTVQ